MVKIKKIYFMEEDWTAIFEKLAIGAKKESEQDKRERKKLSRCLHMELHGDRENVRGEIDLSEELKKERAQLYFKLREIEDKTVNPKAVNFQGILYDKEQPMKNVLETLRLFENNEVATYRKKVAEYKRQREQESGFNPDRSLPAILHTTEDASVKKSGAEESNDELAKAEKLLDDTEMERLKNPDEYVELTKFKTKKEFEAEFGGYDKLSGWHEDDEGSAFFYADYANKKVTIRIKYAGEEDFSRISITVEKFRELMEGKMTFKEILGFDEKKAKNLAKSEIEVEAGKELTEKEKKIKKIFEKNAGEFMSRLIKEANWKGYSAKRKKSMIEKETVVFMVREFENRKLFSGREEKIAEQIFGAIKK